MSCLLCPALYQTNICTVCLGLGAVFHQLKNFLSRYSSFGQPHGATAKQSKLFILGILVDKALRSIKMTFAKQYKLLILGSSVTTFFKVSTWLLLSSINFLYLESKATKYFKKHHISLPWQPPGQGQERWHPWHPTSCHLCTSPECRCSQTAASAWSIAS